MILPILRLVLIYFLLVAGVVAVFNRDKLAPLLPGARDRQAAAETAPADTRANAPAPLAEVPVFEETPTDGTAGAPDPTAPVFPDSAELAAPVTPDAAVEDSTAYASEGTALDAPTVTPAPGIAPEGPLLVAPPAVTPADAATGESPAPETTTASPAQPAKPGSPAPLGTPVASAPQTDPAPLTAPQPEPQPAGNATAVAPAAPAVPAPAAAKPASDPAPAAPAAPTTPTAAGSDDPAALAEAIGTARAAYWSGDIEGARARMAALVEAHPDNPDVAGELGNLAFALRDYPAAAEAWHRAGLLLIDRGEGARVMSFLQILQSIAPDKAAELAARLQER